MDARLEPRFAAVLERARVVAETVLEPAATTTDRSPSPPIGNLRALAEAGLLGISTPVDYGGLGAPRPVMRQYSETLAAACGVTSFLQMQHLLACVQLAQSENETLKRDRLPQMAAGRRLVGVAWSDIRHPGRIRLQVRPDGDGFVVDGVAPWMSGAGVMDEVIVGGELPDGRLIFLLAPLTGASAPEVGAPIALCVMNATATVSLTFRQMRLGPAAHVRTIPRERLDAEDRRAILNYVSSPLGISTAVSRRLAARGSQRKPLLTEAAGALAAEAAAIRAEVEYWEDRVNEDAYVESALNIRAWALELGLRSAQTLCIAGGGASNRIDDPAQRLLREAMHYSLSNPLPAAQSRLIERARDLAQANVHPCRRSS